MGTLLAICACLFSADGLTRSGHPGPLTFTVEDYDARYAGILQGTTLSGVKLPAKVAMELVAQSRMKEYPPMSLKRKRSLYAKELKLIDLERDRRMHAGNRRAVEELGKGPK